ncbi:CCA tRNA nucleotidyltransferase [Candidatus Phytoplasma sacchari]|uniref:CCA tRNA nucleotidyltransferase n=1 Tax=Candidatus Phytoplasma sacchari TaxID=2609813 RepID=A0ABY7M2C1_9MOLU|nr:CCA tRNA nucleotidyltransferase [Candidatus Phytoplasma sacchari]
MKILKKNGFEAFIVGGAIRDFFLNIPFYDIDITTNAQVKDIKKIFKHSELSISEKYGSIKIYFDENYFDITSYRKEGIYLNYRNPSYINFVYDIKEDIKRRDFTINCLLIDDKYNLIDHFYGYKDLLKRKIKTIGDPFHKLTEDVVRMFRIFYLQARLNFEIDLNTQNALIENIFLLKKIKKERIIQELKKIFDQKYIEKVLLSFKKTNAIFFLREFSNYFPILLEI